MTEIISNIYNIGINDYKTDLFEGQYPIPNGIAYNSYVIVDEKIVIQDTVDFKFFDEWSTNLKSVLKDRHPDYLVVHHMEPDHSANIEKLLEMYPNIQIVGNSKTFSMMNQFFPNLKFNSIEVKEGTVLNLGKRNLTFYFAPMVHWPEVMVTYLDQEKILFSADAFGKFGAVDKNDEWINEARRYYFGIVGKYGTQVQNLLKKINDLDIDFICSLHGPILHGKTKYYLDLYNTWSKYEVELNGTLIAYSSMYGNTKQAAYKLFEGLKAKGETIEIIDLARNDIFEAIAKAFAYPKLIIASPTYNTNIFPAVDHFLQAIIDRNYQNRTVGIIENGTWGPFVAKRVKEKLANSKDIQYLENIVSIKSALNDDSLAKIQDLINEIK